MSEHPSSSPLVAAYDAVRTEIAAVDPKTYAPFPANVAQKVSTILNVHPKLAPYEEALSRLPDFNMQSVHKLPTYGLATLHANSTHQPRSRRADAEVLQRGIKMRERYRNVMGTLVEHGLLNDERLQTITMLRGFESVAGDLVVYANVFRDGWAQVQNNAPVHVEDLDASDELAVQLFAIHAYRTEKKKQDAPPPVVVRVGAFTLFANAWDEIERGLTYLFWRDSAKLEELAVLHRKGPRRRAKRKARKAKAQANAAANPPVKTSPPTPAEPPAPAHGGEEVKAAE